MSDEFIYIGKAAQRQEAPDKVAGRAVYAGDIYLPGMLYGAVLRSPFPHARIVRIDPAAALSCPGVKAVITANDLPLLRLGENIKDQPVLAQDKVRFAGERIAAVAAVDEDTARRAAALIRVEFEPLPAVFESEEAMAADAPLVHASIADYCTPDPKAAGNLYGYKRIATGNVDEGWAQSDYIFEDSFTTPSSHQGYLENHAALAMVERDGRATIWTSNKSPFRIREQLAEYIGLPENYFRIVAPMIGGEFGGKGAMMDEPLCYYLSQITGRPVRMVMRRSEELAAANPRHPTLITIKSGLKKNGELVARQVRIVYNSGAYGGVKPGLVLEGHSKTAGPYRIPHLLIEGYAVYSNNNPCGHCRAPGHPQAVFAVESHMDLLARRLGMDPLAFRLLNVLKEGETAPTGEKWHDLRAREVLETAATVGGWGKVKPAGVGRGLALAYRNTGGGESGAVVKVNNDGSVEVITGATETGTGSWTILRQIAAEELGIDTPMVRLIPGDTSVAPFDRGSGASRETHVAGWAVRQAAQEVAAVLKKSAAKLLDCAIDEILVQKGSFWQAGQAEHCLSLVQVVEAAGKKGPIISHASYEARKRDTVAFTAHLAEVRVDEETGAVEVSRLVAVHDIGRVINPPAAEGQVEGSAVQALGFTLWEDLTKQEGKLCSSSLADYHQPTSLDLPEVEVVFVEGAYGPAPYGGKGIGEVPVVPVAAAIANALEDAVGIRMRDLPLTPERVWQAIQKKEGAGK